MDDTWNVCRICVIESPNLVGVNQTFVNCGIKTTLQAIYNECSPVQIEPDDSYPQKFCLACLSELLKTYEFRQKCLRSKELLEERSKCLDKKRKRSHTSSDKAGPSNAKIQKRNDANIDFENVIVKNEIIYQNSSEDDEDPEEYTEYIEEEAPSISHASPKKMIIKMTEINGTLDARPVIPKRDFTLKKAAIESKSAIVPKDKSKSTTKKEAHPDLGTFKITVMRGYKNSSHVVYEANGFLYVNTRNTPHRRYLRCSTSKNCPGKACIDVKPHDEMEEYLYVYKLHNHPKDTLHIMKLKLLEEMRTIASVGNYTAKQVYDLAIRKFPDLKTVMPYTTLSSRLYRLATGPSVQSQLVDTLYKFGYFMTTEKPIKYSMTQSGQPFFQEIIFNEETNTCSVIFANTQLIENVSWNNELFIDSSFTIKFENKQNYNFLTVCISVNEHRFPVFFSIMESGTFEEYSKVLTLFKDKYAPNLHPEEIVTDFNVSLFKAVSEVYNHSTISGSLIHYIFNIYKQYNVDDIIKQIEEKADCMKMQTYLFSLPILPPQMIPQALEVLKLEANQNGIDKIFEPIFNYIEEVWINQVTPQVFSSFCNLNGVNENIFNTYKKIRDIISSNKNYSFVEVSERLIAIEDWVSTTYQKVLNREKLPRQCATSKYSKILDRLWQPNHIDKYGYFYFFESISPLIEKMTGLIWIWGFYNYTGKNDEPLITPQDYFGMDITEQQMIEANRDHVKHHDDVDDVDGEIDGMGDGDIDNDEFERGEMEGDVEHLEETDTRILEEEEEESVIIEETEGAPLEQEVTDPCEEYVAIKTLQEAKSSDIMTFQIVESENVIIEKS